MAYFAKIYVLKQSVILFVILIPANNLCCLVIDLRKCNIGQLFIPFIVTKFYEDQKPLVILRRSVVFRFLFQIVVKLDRNLELD
jgi:hypothetical protein